MTSLVGLIARDLALLRLTDYHSVKSKNTSSKNPQGIKLHYKTIKPKRGESPTQPFNDPGTQPQFISLTQSPNPMNNIQLYQL